jgi:hypothetical protein
VAPKTFSGQLFCILYALIGTDNGLCPSIPKHFPFANLFSIPGIPFTLLAIADLGKFLSEILESWEKVYARIWKFGPLSYI